jgi:hypothetical protein
MTELELTNDQWVDLIRTDGEFLASCCANVSAIRGILISILRGGAPFGIRKWDAESLLANLSGHEIDLGAAFNPGYVAKSENDPWPKIAKCCLGTIGFASLSEFQADQTTRKEK